MRPSQSNFRFHNPYSLVQQYETPERDDDMYQEEEDPRYSASQAYKNQNIVSDKQRFEELRNQYHKAVGTSSNQSKQSKGSNDYKSPPDSKKKGQNVPQHKFVTNVRCC